MDLLYRRVHSLWPTAIFPLLSGILYGIYTRKIPLTFLLRTLPPSLFFVLFGVGISAITLLGLNDLSPFNCIALAFGLYLLAALPSLVIGLYCDWRRRSAVNQVLTDFK